ncbi:MAG: carbonic anhydrase [Gemmataceae bacterium]|nr:carbonic anhydrase [Gemmataceae bacterium]
MAQWRREVRSHPTPDAPWLTLTETAPALVITCMDRHLPLERLLQFRPTLTVWRTADGLIPPATAASSETRQRLADLIEQRRIGDIWLVGHSRCSAVPTGGVRPVVDPTEPFIERVRQRLRQAAQERSEALARLTRQAEQLALEAWIGPAIASGRMRVVSWFRLDETGEFLIQREPTQPFEPLLLGGLR